VPLGQQGHVALVGRTPYTVRPTIAT
jgi:hypothetical protein